MTYLQLLEEGIIAIAKNHGCETNISSIADDGEVFLMRWGEGITPGTICDAELFADELKLGKENVHTSNLCGICVGVDIYIPEGWFENYSDIEFVPDPTINGMWCRSGQFKHIFNN